MSALALLRTAGPGSDPVVIARNFFEAQAELFAALERARVVGVLDTYCAPVSWRNWRSWPGPVECSCTLTWARDRTKDFYGATPDEARAKAAAAIEAGEV